MKFDLEEVIHIADYVSFAQALKPTIETKVLVKEYLEIKQNEQKSNSVAWWKTLSEQDKWNKTINHIKHWEDFTQDDIFELWLNCGFSN